MKKLSILFILLTNVAFSQNSFWSEPVFFTDTLSDNKNSDYLYSFYDETETEYLAWEKSTDSLSTEIHMMKIGVSGSEEIVLGETGVHFKNPKFLSMRGDIASQTYDTLFYLFYERHQNNESDIYYVKYHEDGNFSAPLAFSVEGNENISMSINFLGNITWVQDGMIMATSINQPGPDKYHFYDPAVVDSGDCNNPTVGIDFAPFLCWEKAVNDTIKLFYSKSSGENNWNAPTLQDLPGQSINPSYKNCSSFWNLENMVFWQNKVNDHWEIFYHDYYYTDSVFCPIDFKPGYDKTEPSFVNQLILVDESALCYYTGITTFVLDSLGYTDIYANPYYDGSSEFVNVSKNNFPDQNPQIHYGPWYSYNYAQFLIIWESFVNGHWVLNYSKVYLLVTGGTKEIEKDPLFGIQSIPNPVQEFTRISFNNPSMDNFQLSVFDPRGTLIRQWNGKSKGKQIQSISWDISDKRGRKVPPGLYICTLTIGERSESIKIIVN
ncbi:MAG: T9SS type A sorting domain-containing protein [Bacteroidota bacterium]|nr:T9SS type A sorting domain-containing protein [Bacteroidota bacterium]